MNNLAHWEFGTTQIDTMSYEADGKTVFQTIIYVEVDSRVADFRISSETEEIALKFHQKAIEVFEAIESMWFG